MPRNKTRINYAFMVTPNEQTVLKELAGGYEITVYVRRLIAQDAERRGMGWPDELPAPAVKRKK